MPELPAVPPRALLTIRVCQFVFGILSLALSAASIQIYKNIPRPATGDNVFLLTASGMQVLPSSFDVMVTLTAPVLLLDSGLLTTAYRIITYKARNPNGRHRLIPVTTETLVVVILLAAFIYGAVTTSRGSGACTGGETEEGDGDEEGNVVGGGSSKACSLTKAATAFTASLSSLLFTRSLADSIQISMTGRQLCILCSLGVHCRQSDLRREEYGGRTRLCGVICRTMTCLRHDRARSMVKGQRTLRPESWLASSWKQKVRSSDQIVLSRIAGLCWVSV